MYKKTSYKILTSSTLAAVIVCSSIGSTSVFASETKPPSMEKETKKVQNHFSNQPQWEKLRGWNFIVFSLQQQIERIEKKAPVFFAVKEEYPTNFWSERGQKIHSKLNRLDSALLTLKDALEKNKNNVRESIQKTLHACNQAIDALGPAFPYSQGLFHDKEDAMSNRLVARQAIVDFKATLSAVLEQGFLEG